VPEAIHGRAESNVKTRLGEALANNLTKQSSQLTDEELAVFEEDLQLAQMSEELASALCDELANYVKPEEDPKAAKAFLESFATWVERQRKAKAARKEEEIQAPATK
jgi:hypothetical protein